MRKFFAGLVVGAVIASASLSFANNAVRMFVNGREVVSDVPPQIIEGRTLVPARALAEALGATVGWDAEARAVTVTATLTPTNLAEIQGENSRLATELTASKRGAESTKAELAVAKRDLMTAKAEIAKLTTLPPVEGKPARSPAPSTTPAPAPAEPVQLGTTLSQVGISVTVDRIEYLETKVQPGMPYEMDIFFTVTNNSATAPLRGPGRFYFMLSDAKFEKEFNSLGQGHIGDGIAWVYPGESRQVGLRRYFHSDFRVVEVRWTGTYEDNNSQIHLGPWGLTLPD